MPRVDNFVSAFIELIEDLVHFSYSKKAILTIRSERGDWSETIEVVALNSTSCGWGYSGLHRDVIAQRLINTQLYPFCAVVRTFTERTFKITTNGEDRYVPGKQIRMYYAHRYGRMQQMSMEACFACMNTNATTMTSLPLDPTVEFIGPSRSKDY